MEASPKQTSPGTGSGAVASRLLMMQPDSVLCKLSARGGDDAFAVLYSRYRQQVFAFVFHLLDRPSARDDAEDITQEVFSKAYTAMHTKQPDGSFKHWLFTIARHRTFDAIRALKPNAIPIDTTEDTVEMPTSGQSASSAVEAKQELAWLVGTVSGLPERQREALVMRELAGMSHAQIADALHTSVSATKQLISRGRDSVHEAARENGYRSRRLGRELAMAAPILPFVAFNFGAATSTAGASTAAAGVATGASAAGTAATTTGFGGLALGTKVAATILAVAAVGGGTVVAERAVTAESPQSTAAVSGGSGNGPGTSSGSNNGLTSTEAQQQAAEKKREARAKAKRAKQRAEAKRQHAAKRAKQKRLNAKKNALRKQNAAANKGGNGNTSDRSSSGGSSDRATTNGGGSGGKDSSPAPTKPETSEPPANSNGGSGQGNSGDKKKP